MAKKLNKLSPVAQLEVLRSLVKDGHRYQHKAQQIVSNLKISLPLDLVEADHLILGLMAKGNKRLIGS